jgi:hypothetical protein
MWRSVTNHQRQLQHCLQRAVGGSGRGVSSILSALHTSRRLATLRKDQPPTERMSLSASEPLAAFEKRSIASPSWGAAHNQPQNHSQQQKSPSSTRLTHLTLRQIQVELFRFGRRRVHEHQALVHLMEELLDRPPEVTERNKFVRILVIRDALYLSHLAGLHGHCTELFLSTMRHSPTSLSLSDSVVDSAFSHGSAAVLSAIVDASVSRLQGSPDDAGTEAALYRLVWLCALRSLELDEERAIRLRGGNSKQRVASSKQTTAEDLHETRLQYENVARDAIATLFKANPSIAASQRSAYEMMSGSLRSKLSSDNDDVKPSVALMHSGTQPGTHPKRSESGASLAVFEELWSSAVRFARYHYMDDGGEAQYYKHLYDHNWLRNRHAPQTVTVMIRSCNRSQNVKLVKEYFNHFVAHVMHGATDNPKDSALNTEPSGDGEDSGSAQVLAGVAPSQHRKDSAKFQEVVIHTYFQTLVNSRAYQDVVDAAANLFVSVDTYAPSTSILAVVSRAAGEVRNSQLAMHCASLLFASTTQHPGGGGGGSSGELLASGTPVPGDADVSSAMERGFPSSYEVFITLVALAKCHATSFLPLLEKVRTISVISPNDEETLCLQLHYLRRSPHVLSETNRILADIRAKPIASVTLLSVRNMTLLLLLLQHCNHDAFVETYRDYTKRSSEKSHLWCLVLLQWAELRRYTLSNADRDFIIRILRDLQKEVLLATSGTDHSSSSSSSTASLWHTVTSWITPTAGDTALQRGAVAVFLADSCAMGRLGRAEAFGTAHGASASVSDDDSRSARLPQWPLDDSSLRFTLKPSGKLSAGLRHNTLLADSLTRDNSFDVSSGLAPSMIDAQMQYWDDSDAHPSTTPQCAPRREELSTIMLTRSLVTSMMSISN